MNPIQYIHSAYSQDLYDHYIKYSQQLPVLEPCCIPFRPAALRDEHDKFMIQSTWIVYVSRYDLVELTAFLDQIIHFAEIKAVQRLIIILPMAWGISPVHNMLRAAAYRICASHLPVTVIQYPLFFHEVFTNKQLLWEGGYLMLPIGKSNVPWVSVEALIKQLYIALNQPAPHAQVNYLTHSVKLGGRDIASILSRLSKQVGYEVYSRELFQRIDSRADQVIDQEELLRHWEPLNWSKEEKVYWLQKSIPTENQRLTSDDCFAPLTSHMLEHLGFAPQSISYLHVATGIALQGDHQKYDLEQNDLQWAIEYWKYVGEQFAQAIPEVPDNITYIEEQFAPYFHKPARVFLIPGEGFIQVLNTPYSETEKQRMVLRNGDILNRSYQSNSHNIVVDQELAKPSSCYSYRFKDAHERRIGLDEEQLIYIQSEWGWQGWPDALALLTSGETFPEWKRKLFHTTGELKLTKDQLEGSPEDILCNCTGLTRAACWKWMEQGCNAVKEIAEKTEATTVCGGCYPLIEEVVEDKQLVFAEIRDKYYLGGEITRLRIAPVREPVVQAEPGQHILLQGKMGNEWVTRAYTLTATTSQYYEIAIKREDHGKFSRWLSDDTHEDILLRISTPRGNFTLATRGGAVYFFAGGIGVTPALAMVRTLPYRREKRLFHLDWSIGSRDKLVFEEEINYWERRIDRFSRTFRITSEVGRLSQTHIREIYPYHEGDIAYICGPDGYNKGVMEGLRQAGWPDSQMKLEEFTSSPKLSWATATKPKSEPLSQDQNTAYIPQPTGCPIHHPNEFFLAEPEEVNVYQEAKLFLKQCYYESGIPEQFEARWEAVKEELDQTATYTHTYDELVFGARVAWRNSTRCIGRFFWDKLQIRDVRHLETAEEMFQAMIDHIRAGTNQGELIPMISIFAPKEGLRIWNPQLIQYAAYQEPDGSVIGDPKNLDLTERIMELGWPGGERTHFDILPLVIQIPGEAPQWFEIPKGDILEVPIVHPRYTWFEDLDLKWYALPAVSNMALDMGGIQYTLVPFNGFYMGTEIGARNFADTYRYDMLKTVAEKLDLDTSRSYTLWKDVAMVELNIAVLYSYQQKGVRMMDHHTLSEYFLRFDQQESACQRPVYADWTWIVPPLSGSSVEIFHIDKWENKLVKPNYFYMEDPWKSVATETIPVERHPVHMGNYSG